MRTHIELDDQLINEICKMGNFATKRAAVNTALAEYAKLLKRRNLLALQGKVPWEGDVDALRRSRSEQAE